jgi:hypothetical protein
MGQPPLLTRSDLLIRLHMIAGILDADDVAESYRITCVRRLVRRLELDLGGADTCRLVPDRGSDRPVGGESRRPAGHGKPQE